MGIPGTRIARALSVAAIATAASTLGLAAPAGATITRSQVTTPSREPTYLTSNYNVPNTVAVAGTTNSNAPSTDTVDLLCFYGDNGLHATLATGVPLNPANGSFATKAPLHAAQALECRLRAVPAHSFQNSPAFAGPLLEVNEVRSYAIDSGTNSGQIFDYYVYGQQPTASDDFVSIGHYGLDDSYLVDNAYGQTTTVFYGNAYLDRRNLDGTGDTRSEILVDGKDAYVPYSAANLFTGSSHTPGLTKTTYSYHVNNRTGDVTITETDPVIRCLPGGYPPTAANCTSFAATGVKVHRTFLQTAGGHVVYIADAYTSTDGKAHSINLLYQNDQCLSASNSCPEPRIAFRFPGQRAYALHQRGDTLHVPKGKGSIYIKVTGAPDGDPYTGQAAITYAQAPQSILFVSPANYGESDFTMHYSGKVPAKGALGYKFAYSTEYTFAAVSADALRAQKLF